MKIGVTSPAFALVGLALLSNIAGAAGSCHIHQLGIDPKEAEVRIVEWYKSLEECELAIRKFFGGTGVCHCLPDGIFNRSRDDWRSRPRDIDAPRESP
jgi:hypothetical protein